MPEPRTFVDPAGVPASYDFESIKVSKRHPFNDVGDASHVLVPYGSRQVIGTINPNAKQITTSMVDVLAGKPTLYWTAHGVLYYGADTTTEYEVVRTFSYDKEETEIEWIAVVSTLPAVFSKFFKPSAPTLWTSRDGRFCIVDSEHKPIVTVHDLWRDTDKARGVSHQYVVRDKNHPMWREALWTAFSLRP